MTAPVGCDVSHWQAGIAWGQMVAAGAKFVVVRAGSIDNLTGVPYEDYRWASNSIEAPKHLPMGSYWYFRPKYSGIVQAQYFANLLKGKDLKLPAYIDVEVGEISQTVARTRTLSFLQELEAQTGKKPGIYTSASKWNTIIGNVPWASGYELWTAHYTIASAPYIPWGWSAYTLWQYTSKGPGATYGVSSASIDLNRFNGTEEQFNQHYNLGHAATLEDRVLALERWAKGLGYGG